MTQNNILNKIIIHTNTQNTKKKNTTNLTNIITCLKTITRQTPNLILDKKKKIIGAQTTLRNKKLNNFLQKLLTFTVPKFYSNSLTTKKIYSLDKYYNIIITIKNHTYFFEYLTMSLVDTYYIFTIKLIFNKTISNTQKLLYLTTNFTNNKKNAKHK